MKSVSQRWNNGPVFFWSTAEYPWFWMGCPQGESYQSYHTQNVKGIDTGRRNQGPRSPQAAWQQAAAWAVKFAGLLMRSDECQAKDIRDTRKQCTQWCIQLHVLVKIQPTSSFWLFIMSGMFKLPVFIGWRFVWIIVFIISLSFHYHFVIISYHFSIITLSIASGSTATSPTEMRLAVLFPLLSIHTGNSCKGFLRLGRIRRMINRWCLGFR